MRLFLSWSGVRSRALAGALHDWLPGVLQAVQPWMSSEDIEKGSRWPIQLAERLNEIDFGILCVTPENRLAPWMLFEAGALSKSLISGSVATVLLDITSAALTGPLAQFQDTKLTHDDVFLLVDTINRRLSTPLPERKLAETFEIWWPRLEERITAARGATREQVVERSDREVLDEILLATRSLSKSRAQSAPIELYGGVRDVINNWKQADWHDLLAKTTHLDALMREGNLWRSHNVDGLAALVQRPSTRVRVVLPDPDHSQTMAAMAVYLREPVVAIRERVIQSAEQFQDVAAGCANGATLRVYFVSELPTYVLFRMNTAAIVTFYGHRETYRPQPTLLLDSSSSFVRFFDDDFETLVKAATRIT